MLLWRPKPWPSVFVVKPWRKIFFLIFFCNPDSVVRYINKDICLLQLDADFDLFINAIAFDGGLACVPNQVDKDLKDFVFFRVDLAQRV